MIVGRTHLFVYQFDDRGSWNVWKFTQQTLVQIDKNQIIISLHGVETYQDDIAFHAENTELHSEHVLELLIRYCDTNVAGNPYKC